MLSDHFTVTCTPSRLTVSHHKTHTHVLENKVQDILTQTMVCENKDNNNNDDNESLLCLNQTIPTILSNVFLQGNFPSTYSEE